jgi:hypothetical protein
LAGQLFNAAWIAAESSPPLGDNVAQTVEREGIPPFDIIPGFQAKFLSAGMIVCPSANGEERTHAKNRTDALSLPQELERAFGRNPTVIFAAPLRADQ